ncbi:hypothetical protein BG011_009129 [Mortierella polycephala]|uniref:Uncharacterized protein n=1 Tax=Mortierella polycephala TaxID=41804 RepID=A0A9P6PLR6_9FUNG|nr:hypothetical protein BG011_009129 [Mortierella polycephala]
MGLPSQTRRSHDSQAETTRAAAAAAIANTLSRGDPYLTRGESPYIPSSLSMLFSDPEVMQAQEELDRAHLHQQQQQLRQRYMDSQRSFSGENSRDVEDEHELCDDDERTQLLSLPLGAQDETVGGYGFEVVVQDSRQDEEVYHPYATVLSRHDYLAPHEPSSSSPLFPSPLTTLGRFGRNSLLADSLEGQHAQAGRIWQDYGGAIDNLEQQDQANIRTPLNQSHAAYYHAVSNYHYTSYGNENNDNGASGSGTTSSIAQGNSGCVPLNGEQWRRQHGRGNSQQSYTSGSGSGYGSGGEGGNRHGRGRGQHRDRSEDHWSWRMYVPFSFLF